MLALLRLEVVPTSTTAAWLLVYQLVVSEGSGPSFGVRSTGQPSLAAAGATAMPGMGELLGTITTFETVPNLVFTSEAMLAAVALSLAPVSLWVTTVEKTSFTLVSIVLLSPIR